jgi:acyl-CoA thioester hydrolase
VSPRDPVPLYAASVRPEWIDRNGHLNLAYYVVLFDHATDLLFDALGIGAAYSERSGNSLFVAETHILYERELREAERVSVASYVLGADAKRLHFALQMHAAGEQRRAALQELMAVHVDMSARKVTPFPPDRRAAIAELAAVHAERPRPAGLGRRIALPG